MVLFLQLPQVRFSIIFAVILKEMVPRIIPVHHLFTEDYYSKLRRPFIVLITQSDGKGSIRIIKNHHLH